jgi:hypothetical protein
LRWLIEDDNPRFLQQGMADRIRNILTALVLAEDIGSFINDAPPGTLHPVGAYIGSRATGRTNGAFLYPAIGELPSKKLPATLTG